ncbi:uncharacterized protein B0H18DRAFT_29181 [Fomitopsis serialis]|uniref:uncharacterized protein n=1 Tax=Fomitopsis serialis TaxID=139415 RepID=UPI002007A4D7|nr:uncharacterized protein B0H18DRAFT_29181 [Neoantrodia serialis]KAH9932544.1 hypothetical protein B0H18DRAFT_29181 [Neoantrodia serialis]
MTTELHPTSTGARPHPRKRPRTSGHDPYPGELRTALSDACHSTNTPTHGATPVPEDDPRQTKQILETMT